MPAGAAAVPITAGLAVAAYAEACGVLLTAETAIEALLTVVSVPLDVVLEPAPDPVPSAEPVLSPDPTAGPSASPRPVPTAEPSPEPTPGTSPDAGPSPDPAVPVPLLLGPEPLTVVLLPTQGAGPEDAYRVVLTDPVALVPLLEVELVLPLCVPPAVGPTGPPGATPTSTTPAGPETGPSSSPDPSASLAATAGPTAPSAATAPASVEQAVINPVQVVAAPPRRSFGRAFAPPLSALRARSRAAESQVTTALSLPELAAAGTGTDVAGPAPIVAYPPGTTGVLLPAPPDRPLALLLPLQSSAGTPAPALQRVTLARSGPTSGAADALPAALLAAAAAAGFLATQLRRRVPLRRS